MLSKVIKADCVQSSRLSLWRKREDEFATAWLPCQSLSGRVRRIYGHDGRSSYNLQGKGCTVKVILGKLCLLY